MARDLRLRPALGFIIDLETLNLVAFDARREVLDDITHLVHACDFTTLWALRDESTGIAPNPDGRVRLEGVMVDNLTCLA